MGNASENGLRRTLPTEHHVVAQGERDEEEGSEWVVATEEEEVDYCFQILFINHNSTVGLVFRRSVANTEKEFRKSRNTSLRRRFVVGRIDWLVYKVSACRTVSKVAKEVEEDRIMALQSI